MDELRESLIARLKRIEGQARGIQRMIEEKRSCDEIIVQLAAIKAAIDQVAVNILGHHMAECIEKNLAQGRDVQDAIAEFMPIFRKLS
ncbi:MAG: metal-sensitive transcriptional regulator [Firmicutes bacterium]|nr:metal-sensitive transcriptional regulator [Bacillota bacterium]